MRVTDTLPIDKRSSVWAVIDGSLHECVATGFTQYFSDDNNRVKYNVKVKDTNEIEEVSPNDLYLSEKDFVEGKQVSKLPPFQIYINETCGKCAVDERTFEGTFYIFKDSMPTKVTKKIKSFTFDYQTSTASFSFYDFKADTPRYLTYEECFVYNDYTVTLSDGTVVKRESIMKLLALNDKQRQIVKELEDVLKKASNANINIIFDSETDELYVANRSDKVSWTQGKNNINFVNWRKELTKVPSDIYSVYSENVPSMKLE